MTIARLLPGAGTARPGRFPLAAIGRLFALRPESDCFLHLDALRFIASAGIVLFHYQEWIWWPGAPEPLRDLIGFPLFVDVFYVISGMVIFNLYRDRMKNSTDYLDFLGKRVARLGPLHWLTFLFFCAVAIASLTLANDAFRPEWSCALPTILMVHALGMCHRLSFNTPSWSISAEMAVYVAFPLVLALVRRPRLGWTVLALILLGLSLGSLAFAPRTPWYDRTYAFGVVRAVPGFLFGALVASRRDLLARIRSPGLLMGGALAAFVALRVFRAPGLLDLAAAYAIPVFAYAADQTVKPGRVIGALAPLGQLTYSIYLLHLPVAWLCILIIARHLGLKGPEMDVAVLGTALVAVPIAAVLSLRLFETPSRRWLARRLKPAPGPALHPPRDVATARDFAP